MKLAKAMVGCGIVLLACAVRAQSPAAAPADDPYVWLEPLENPQVMTWVREQNTRTLTALEADARYPGLLKEATAVAQSADRLPQPRIIGGAVLDFWQDARHVRGIWRRSTLGAFVAGKPHWRTVLDLDALSASEKANWVWKDADCDPLRGARCMVYLSDGGEDAIVAREFDLAQGRFVKGGFQLPRAKLRTSWEDRDTLLVASEWTAGDLTDSGYPYIVKRWRRGQPLAAATEIFRGAAHDGGYGVTPMTVTDGHGRAVSLIQRPLSTFEAETYLVSPKSTQRLDVPLKLDVGPMVDGQLVLRLAQDWSRGAQVLAAGSVVAIDVAAARKAPANLQPVVVFAPGPREAVKELGSTRDSLVLTTLDTVRGRGATFRRGKDGTWTRTSLSLPDNVAVSLGDTDLHGATVILRVEGFLTPPALWVAGDTVARPFLTQPPLFDASRDAVEQFETASSDGTMVPYFVVHPREAARDGHNAAILNAYGGFEISEVPHYSAVLGKLWLERGGTYVLANIRGGGEFGPAWHEAGLKTHRQKIYDDFAAVARDLAHRGIADADHLGISGGSNGGLLMGVEMTQHPELFHAVEIAVPLLDMLRFESIQAGASWVGEYGSVSVPEEKAFLASISPYANLRKGVAYPEPFVWTTTKDDRVGPQHARKFAARLAEYGIPYYFYEVTEGGHGAGANLQETARTRALTYTYFMRRLMAGATTEGSR